MGKFRRQTLPTGERLLVDEVNIVDELPVGLDRPPLDDYFLLHLEYASTHGWPAAELIRRSAPLGAQSLAALVVQRNQQLVGGWDAAMRTPEGQIVEIDRVRVSGPGLLKLGRRPTITELTDEQARRWSRTIGVLGLEAFHRLREMTITIVGAGRTGSLMAAQLVAIGVGHLRLVDADVVEDHNLDTVPNLHPSSRGQSKVQAVAKHLLAARNDLQVTCIAQSVLAQSTAEMLRSLTSDVYISCVDSDAARLAVSLLARESLTAHLDVGTVIRRGDSGQKQMSADIRLLLPSQGCCRCAGRVANEEAALYELSAPPGTLQRGIPLAWNEHRQGSLVSLNSMAVGVGVELLRALVAGDLQTSFWQRLDWDSATGLRGEAAAVRAAENCPLCHL
jgi:hypothetical protein